MAYVAGAAATPGTGTSIDVPVPTGAAANHIAVVYLYHETDDVTITPPTGFILKSESLFSQGSVRGRIQQWWKRVTASDAGNYTFTWTTSCTYDGYAQIYSGRVRYGDPFDANSQVTNASSSALTQAVSITTNYDANDLTGAAVNHSSNAGAWTPPSGMTEVYDPAGVAHLSVDYQDNVTTGTYNLTFTGTGSASNTYIKAALGALLPEMAPSALLATINTTTNTGPYTSGSFTPDAGTLLVFSVSPGAVDAVGGLTASANGVTFTRVGAATRASVDTCELWVANQLVPFAPASMTVTYTPGLGGAVGCIGWVVGWAGITKTGTAAIKQSAFNNGAGAASTTASFGAAVTSGNPVGVSVFNTTSPATMTPPTSFVELSDVGYATPNRGGETAVRNTGHTSAAVTYAAASASAWGLVTYELDTAPVAARAPAQVNNRAALIRANYY